MAFSGDCTPVLAKHSRSFNLLDAVTIGVDWIQRNFEPLRRQVEEWRAQQITDVTATLVIYRAFVEDALKAPTSLMAVVHKPYFQPQYEEFASRTMWSLSNAFASALKQLDPIPQFKATAKLGEFLSRIQK